MVQKFVMDSLPDNPVAIEPDEDYPDVTHVTFGAGVAISHVADALAKLPPSAQVIGAKVVYFCEAEDCEGTDVPDQLHLYMVITFGVSDGPCTCDDHQISPVNKAE